MNDITAIVVARAGSTRLPGKALLPFAGATLVGHKVRQLKACPSVTRVIIGSDSDEILAEGVRHGATALKRTAFCDEVTHTANDMIADVVGRVEGDIILWAHPTNPLVSPRTFERAIGCYLGWAGSFAYDSLASVAAVRRHAWWEGRPLNHQPWTGSHQVGAALPPVLLQDGAIFIQPRARMLANRSFYGKRPFLFEMPENESADIDTAADYAAAMAVAGAE